MTRRYLSDVSMDEPRKAKRKVIDDKASVAPQALPNRWRNNTKSPNIQHNSLIDMLNPQSDPQSTAARGTIRACYARTDREMHTEVGVTKPVRPRTARRAGERAAKKTAMKAEHRGRRVPLTVAGLESAVNQRGKDGLAEALISRHNQRMEWLDKVGNSVQERVLPILSSYLQLGVFAESLGANPGRFPACTGRNWVEHLAWSIDSTATAVRLLIAVQPVGAAVVARTQLERWSANLAANMEKPRLDKERTADWMSRIWSGSAKLPMALEQPVGNLYSTLSELLHARGPLMDLAWTSANEQFGELTDTDLKQFDWICDALLTSVSQVRAALATVAHNHGALQKASIIEALPLKTRADSWLPQVGPHVWPVMPMYFQHTEIGLSLGAMASGRERVAQSILGGLKAPEPPETWPVLALGAHRFRALTAAGAAYEHEKLLMGEAFGSNPIAATMTRSILAGEMTMALSLWLKYDPERRHIGAAFVVCASALRSATWLWLEDDDRGMGCLRCVVEQIARIRTWRIKSNKAAKLEANPNTKPRDWIEGAGWRRLNILNRALGEYAHMSAGTDWEIARKALVSLQADTDTNPLSNYTGRTNALTVCIYLCSLEIALWTDSFSNQIGRTFREAVGLDDERAAVAIEALSTRAWAVRDKPVRRPASVKRSPESPATGKV